MFLIINLCLNAIIIAFVSVIIGFFKEYTILCWFMKAFKTHDIMFVRQWSQECEVFSIINLYRFIEVSSIINHYRFFGGKIMKFTPSLNQKALEW